MYLRIMKLFFTSAVTILLANFTIGQNLNDNLLLHYPCSGNANDASGNGNDGVGNATLVDDRQGNADEAFYFDGATNFIDLPSNPSLKPSLPVSLAFWVKFDDNDPANSTVLCTDFAQDNHTGVWVSRSSAGNIAANYGDNTGGTVSQNRRTKVGNTPLESGVWYHVVIVVNGPTDMEIYLNCQNDGGTYSGSGGSIGYSSVPGSVGRKDSNTGLPALYFKGTVDDIYYWDRALVSTDIDTLCNNILSIEEAESQNPALTLIPNPASDEVAISGLDKNSSAPFTIVNVQGKIVKEGVLTESKINISDLNEGIYYISIDSQSSSKVLKFIKE